MIERKCSCEMGMHRAPLEKCIIESGAVNRLPDILKDYNKVYMVCDDNTYRVLGKWAEQILTDCGKFSHKTVFHGTVLPDANSIGNVLIHLNDPKADADIFQYSPRPDFILAVGSGVINDICRIVSYRLGLPYGIAATAPSMDGYASAGSPILFDGTKATVKCTTPKYIIADPDVLSEAPFDMLLSGIGDMFGKYTGILDWELARDYSGEYYCSEIADAVIAATDKCLKNGYGIQTRNPDCIKNIMEGFLTTGLGMAFTGNSRPASGAEHIIAHVWELESVEKGERPHLHGLEVCEATRIVADMYRLLYAETKDGHLKKLIEKYRPCFDEIETFCKEMKVPNVTTDYDTVMRAIKRALTLRDRYTILFYLRDRGLLERYADHAARQFLERVADEKRKF